MGSGKAGKQCTFPSPLINKCPSAGGSKPSSFFPGEKCLLASLPCVWIQGAFVGSFLTVQMEDSTGWRQSLMDPLYHEL